MGEGKSSTGKNHVAKKSEKKIYYAYAMQWIITLPTFIMIAKKIGYEASLIIDLESTKKGPIH